MTFNLAALILWTASLPLVTAAPVATEVTFEQHEIVTGIAERQTVVAGFFLDGPIADLAVLEPEGSDAFRLRIFGFGDGSDGRDDSWSPRVDTVLGAGVLFVDVANIDGRDRLITYETGRLNWFDPDAVRERALVEVATSYNARPFGLSYGGLGTTGPADAGEVPHLDVTRDLNHDGRDDLIIPDVDGFSVFTQTDDGTFSDGVRLGPAEPFRDQTGLDDPRTYGEVGITALTLPWYLSRVHQMDYDHDGRTDLVFWNEDHFDVYSQDEHGLFSPVARTFTTEVPFDSDGFYSLVFGFNDESQFSLMFGLKGKKTRTVLHSFRDMNGDGVADLVTQSIQGSSLLKQRSLYAVYFGTPTAGGTTFAPEDATVSQSQGRAPFSYSSLWLEDFDGDDQVDVLYGRLKTGLGAMIRALLGTSATVACELYRLEDGVYPEQPTGEQRVKSDIKFRGGRDAGFFPASLIGDVNGDGRSDVLVGKSREELYVYLGGPDMFSKRPQSVVVALPGDERNSWLVDLNSDGKQDLLMHHPSSSEPHRVTMLIAR